MIGEEKGRALVLDAAESWVNAQTPYHHEAMVKGAGVDCLRIIYASYLEAGVVGPIKIPHYSPQQHLHRGEETFLEGILRFAHEVKEPKPADVVLYRVGRVFWHGAIIAREGWPQIIHANALAKRAMIDDGTSGVMAGKDLKFFSFW